MVWSLPARLALAFGVIGSSAQDLGCQQLRALEVGFQNRSVASVAEGQPSALSLTARSAGWAIFASVLAGGLGLVVDGVYCANHHRYEEGSIFDPCFFYAGEGLATGWFGGATAGATLAAAHVAEKRGCPHRAALLRAFGGAVLGIAPGLSIVAQRSGKYPPSRSVVILGTPLFAGLGAAAAVVGCHAT